MTGCSDRTEAHLLARLAHLPSIRKDTDHSHSIRYRRWLDWWQLVPQNLKPVVEMLAGPLHH